MAQSGFAAFCLSIQNGQYPNLDNREELWKLLAVITLNRARNRAARENSQRRGGGLRQLSFSEAMDGVFCRELDPEVDLAMREDCARLVSLLERREVQEVALLKIQGYTNVEIAYELNCTRRSVQRRLNLIRNLWGRELA